MSAFNEYGLTPQKEKFAQAMGRGDSQSDAYREAYPSSKKWKPETLYSKASALAADGKVKARVAMLCKKVEEKSVLKAAEVINQLAGLVSSDISGIIHTEGPKAGQIKLPNELDASTRAAVASFKIDEAGRIEYKFWDKNSAIEKAMKHLGMYEQDNKQRNPLSDLLCTLNGRVVGPTAQTAVQTEKDEDD